jgi:hypothetical protein
LTINHLTQRILHIESILKNLKQKYAMQCQVAQEMNRRAESVYGKVGMLDQIVEMAMRYNEEVNRVKEENIMLESQSRLMDIEMCESVKVLEEGQGAPYQQGGPYQQGAPYQQGGQMATTFGLPQYRNESLSSQVSGTFEGTVNNSNNIFTFKDMASNQSR